MASTKHSFKRQQKKSLNKFPNLINLTLSLLIILLGSGLLIYSSFKNIDFSVLPTNNQTQSQAYSNADVAKPAKIYIPKMAQVLPVSNGYLNGGRWVTSQIGVSYYTASALPSRGNTVIYGHNTKGILGGLWKVQDGDYIYVIQENGNFVKYRVYERKEIEPTDVEILDSTNDSRLTLYTCSGFLDEARFVVLAKEASL